MTKRRTPIPKRCSQGPLPVNVEMAAAGYLCGFWHEKAMSTREYWQGIAATHGDRILEKLHNATPGCRAGFQYAIGIYPPLPLIADPPPENYDAAGHYIDIDGVRFWYCGAYSSLTNWVVSQADYLHSIGEVDGAEWRRYLAWKRSGYERRYVLDGASHMTTRLAHMCH